MSFAKKTRLPKALACGGVAARRLDIRDGARQAYAGVTNSPPKGAFMPTTNPQSEAASPALVVMGVSGSGKTTVGLRLAKLTGADFIDGDDLHTAEARAKMASGTPLTDDDRWPWLDRIGAALADRVAHPKGLIVASSALRRVYRDRLRARVGPTLRFLYLHGDKALMRERVARRKGHYMPASLIDSQFATLEDPRGESDTVTLAADADLDRALPETLHRLGGASQ
jgi:gluconokinase